LAKKSCITKEPQFKLADMGAKWKGNKMLCLKESSMGKDPARERFIHAVHQWRGIQRQKLRYGPIIERLLNTRSYGFVKNKPEPVDA